MRRRAAGAAFLAARRGAGAAQEAPAHDVSDPGPPPEAALDPVDQLKQLHELREQGILTEAEFSAEKKKLLGI
jgi:hypothetical protein